MSTLAAAIHYLERGDWESAHAIVQNDSSALGCWLHGIVHMMKAIAAMRVIGIAVRTGPSSTGWWTTRAGGGQAHA